MTMACPACTAEPEVSGVSEPRAPNVFLSVPGIHCAGCIRTVETALNAMPGVTGARVNLTLKRVSAETELPADALAAALSSTGYEAYPLETGTLGQQGDPTGRDLALRLGVAGFAMMNVMLLSVAVWSGAPGATRDLFHLISAAIAVPAVAFSAQPFFRHALSALRNRRLNMDVPIALAIILATGMSLFESLNSGRHAYFDAGLSLTFFLLIGRYLDHRTRASARSAAKELAALEVHTAQRMTEKGVETVPVTDLAIGDEIAVPTGVRVPVDGTLLSDKAVTDRSFLTGESDPVTTPRGDQIQAGEVNLGPAFRVKASAVGEDTSLRRIAGLVEQAENARNRYTGLADRAAQIYAPTVHILALAAFFGWVLIDGDMRHALNVAIAVLIITCPCALGLAVPAVSTAAIGKLYEMGFLVKSGTALERLAEVDQVIFDKTGTLTQPGVSLRTTAMTATEKAIALALAQVSDHPVARAIVAELSDITPADVAQIEELPGLGMRGLYGNTPVQLGRGPAGLTLDIGDRSIPIGQSETLRDGAENAVAGIKAQGLGTSLLSGDTPSAVDRTSQDLGIEDAQSGIAPQDKHRIIAERTAAGGVPAMVGDGLNDTAALAAAHASVAPSSALDASRNAADVVLLRDGLEDLPKLFAISRMASKLSRQNFAIASVYNLIAVPIALAGFATPLLAALAMSVSSLTVLINALRVRVSS